MASKLSRGLVAVGSGAGLVSIAVACGTEAGSSFKEAPPDAAAGFDATTGFEFDSGGRPDSSTGVSACEPKIPATFNPVWKAPTRTSACALTDLSGYYDACLTPRAADAGDPCKAFTDAHASCSACVEAPDNAGPIQWHRNRLYYTLNVAGCFALTLGQNAEGQCPDAYSDSVQCQREACNGCFDSADATFGEFQKCQQRAKEDQCKTYDTTFRSVCAPVVAASDSGVSDCQPKASENAKDHFTRVMGIFCGQDD